MWTVKWPIHSRPNFARNYCHPCWTRCDKTTRPFPAVVWSLCVVHSHCQRIHWIVFHHQLRNSYVLNRWICPWKIPRRSPLRTGWQMKSMGTTFRIPVIVIYPWMRMWPRYRQDFRSCLITLNQSDAPCVFVNLRYSLGRRCVNNANGTYAHPVCTSSSRMGLFICAKTVWRSREYHFVVYEIRGFCQKQNSRFSNDINMMDNDILKWPAYVLSWLLFIPGSSLTGDQTGI